MAGRRQEKNAGKAKNFDMNALSTVAVQHPSTASIPLSAGVEFCVSGG